MRGANKVIEKLRIASKGAITLGCGMILLILPMCFFAGPMGVNDLWLWVAVSVCFGPPLLLAGWCVLAITD